MPTLCLHGSNAARGHVATLLVRRGAGAIPPNGRADGAQHHRGRYDGQREPTCQDSHVRWSIYDKQGSHERGDGYIHDWYGDESPPGAHHPRGHQTRRGEQDGQQYGETIHSRAERNEHANEACAHNHQTEAQRPAPAGWHPLHARPAPPPRRSGGRGLRRLSGRATLFSRLSFIDVRVEFSGHESASLPIRARPYPCERPFGNSRHTRQASHAGYVKALARLNIVTNPALRHGRNTGRPTVTLAAVEARHSRDARPAGGGHAAQCYLQAGAFMASWRGAVSDSTPACGGETPHHPEDADRVGGALTPPTSPRALPAVPRPHSAWAGRQVRWLPAREGFPVCTGFTIHARRATLTLPNRR